jgi:Flp pilus assembly protein TadD
MSTHRKTIRSRRDAAAASFDKRPDLGMASEGDHAHDRGTADRWRDFLLHAAIIVLGGLWVYSPVIHPTFPADWLWDDDQLLTANATVQSTTPEALAKLWINPDGADYFPLSYTALWAQWPMFGMWPTGYHLVTVLLHIVGSLLVWRLLWVMRIPGAWLAAAIFALHPVCVESVAWVSELKNTLSLPLFLLAAIHYVKFDDAIDHQGGRQAATAAGVWRHYGVALVCFLLAMLAKTSVVMLPVVLLLHAWWKRGTVKVADVVRAGPFFLISLVLGLVTVYYQHGRAIGQETIPVGGVASRVATAGMSILWYLRLIFWPVNLLPIYPKWEVDPPKAWQFLAWPVIAGGLWWFWRNRDVESPRFGAAWGRNALFGFGFFLLMVLPVLGFITISYMRITWAADHFIYLPMIGVIALVAAGIATWYERVAESERPLFVAGGATLLGALMFLAFSYAGCWVNEDALWTHTLKHNHDAWQAHNRLGAKKFARGDVEGAFYHFTNSTRLRPDLGETHNNLGTALSAKGRLGEAIEQFREAVRVTPHVPAIRVNLANALAAAGRFEEASEKFAELLEIEPGNPALINNHGVTLYKMGRREEAIAKFRRALEIAPELKDAKESLAIALGEKPDPSLGQRPSGPPPVEMSLPPSPTLGGPALAP